MNPLKLLLVILTIASCKDRKDISDIINLKMDSIHKKENRLLPFQTRPNRIAEVNYSFSGCFGGERSQLAIFEFKGAHFAILSTENRTIREVPLTYIQLDSLHRFITQLKDLKEETGCTTTEYYEVYTNKEKIYKTDGGCHWRGFEKLKLSLHLY